MIKFIVTILFGSCVSSAIDTNTHIVYGSYSIDCNTAPDFGSACFSNTGTYQYSNQNLQVASCGIFANKSICQQFCGNECIQECGSYQFSYSFIANNGNATTGTTQKITNPYVCACDRGYFQLQNGSCVQCDLNNQINISGSTYQCVSESVKSSKCVTARDIAIYVFLGIFGCAFISISLCVGIGLLRDVYCRQHHCCDCKKETKANVRQIQRGVRIESVVSIKEMNENEKREGESMRENQDMQMQQNLKIDKLPEKEGIDIKFEEPNNLSAIKISLPSDLQCM